MASSSASDVKTVENRSFLFEIDLNEIPSSPSSENNHNHNQHNNTNISTPFQQAYDVVRECLGNPRPATGGPAELPSERRNEACVCGRTEAKGGVVVCDGCERWFHISCAGMRFRQACVLEDWACASCVKDGVGSKRWPLGFIYTASNGSKGGGVQLLDINALPPSDGDGEGEGSGSDRMYAFDENLLSSSLAYPNTWNVGNEFELQRGISLIPHPVIPGFKGTMQHRLTMSRSFEEADLSSHQGGMLQGNANIKLRRKELARFSRTSHPAEKQEIYRSRGAGLFSEVSMEPSTCTVETNARIAEVGAAVKRGSESQQLNDVLPVQYEDFFVLRLGEIDLRPSYHIKDQIWPVGYQSSWHDRITGSIFMCDVLEGGGMGPIFKVTRFPCCMFLISNGSTILLRPTADRVKANDKLESNSFISPDSTGNEHDAIQMFLYDPDPRGQDLSSCFDSDSYEVCNKDGLPPHTSFLSEGPTKVLPDEIGEFSVEGRSSSLVWSEVSDKLVGVCCEVFKKSGSFHFCCKHELGITDCWSMEDSTDVNPRSLVRFCSSSGFISVPRALQSVSELDIACNALSKWLKQDRFGLDVEFVQELIEQLPGCQSCSGYEFLNKRGKYSSSLTVGSGRLLSKRKMNTHEEDLASANFFYHKKPRKEGSFHTRGRDVHRFPPGKPLSTKLSAELVANILQISEFLWRFYEILGMKEPMSFEELEEELVNPWSDGSTSLEKIEKEIKENKSCTIHEKYDIMDMGFPPKESDQAVPCESIPTFIEMGSAKEASEARVASRSYHRCTGASLTKVHSSLLNVLVGELQVKVASLVDPNFDSGEMKPRRGRKKDVDTSVTLNKSKIDMLPVNELTWPEMARRYVLSVLSMDCNLESSEITSREGGKVFRCLQGDGGVLCGSLTGVAGMEADALLLAEATKQICGSLRRENETWPVVEDKDMDAIGACDTAGANGSGIPEWAQVLEPVRKLPTNVGTRIRKCVYEALDKGPPEWARKILEHSISKEVYKGNASGPTKKAVLSVLANVSIVVPEPKPEKKKKENGVNTIADIISNQCRSVLRRASAADESRTFCNLLGTTSYIDNDDEGILGSPAMVSRPLDFRTIDLRLAVGYYGGSHEAFLEDVREVWRNIHIAYGDKPELIQMAETLSQNFESLYEKEVLPLVQKCRELVNSDCSAPATKKELIEDFNCASSIPKAPWDEGVCKVCGIDRDDESVLLCDTCDSEYHTYCLIPPLAKIPEGNWYCPACVVGQGKFQEASKRTKVITRRRQKRYQGDYSRSSSEAVNRLATTMGEKEYWDFSVEERINLLKFLCDEVLNSALIREHLEHCAETASDLQPKLRALTAELRNLKFREECLTTRPTKDNMITFDGVSESVRDKMTTMLANQDKSIGLQQTVNNNLVSTTGSHIQLQDPPVENSHHSLFCTNAVSDQHCNGGTTAMKVAGFENEASVIDDSLIPENLVSYGMSIRKNENNGTMEQPLSTKEQKFDVMSRELKTHCHLSKKNGFEAANISPVLLSSVQGTFPSGESKQAGYTANGTVTPTKISDLFLGNCFAAQTDLSMPQTPSTEAKSLKNEISLLSESIGRIESQLLKVSMRRELLGRDCAGRLYWVLSRAEKRPWLVVDGSMLVHEKREQNLGKAPLAESSGLCYSSPFCSELSSTSREFFAYSPYRGVKMTPSCVSYDSEAEIQELIRWLRDGDPRERDLSESILQFDKLRSQSNQLAGNVVHVDSQAKSCDGEVIVTPRSLCTKAAAILEKNYGPCLEPETTELPKKRGRKAKVIYGDRMYRCECLEPIWPSRNHCLSCHHTFCTNLELEGHNDGRCNSGSPATDESKESDELSKGKAIMRSEAASACTKEGEVLASDKFEVSSKLTKFQKEEMASPYKVEEISRKFITNDSNRELVREIGLLGSNGIPLFVHTTSPYVHDPTLILDPARKVQDEFSVIPTNTEVHSSHDEANSKHDHITSHSPKSDSVLGKVSVSHGTPGLEAGDCGIVPLSALKPLVGRDSQILRRLKVNLLDIDAALPAEALRPTKANSSTQRSWRAFIKSADSVLDMVKAVIVFEDMIKSEYLRSGWWYWSSLSAAVRTSTISSLALRIYALDSAIIYEKTPADLDGGHQADNLRSSKKRKGNEG